MNGCTVYLNVATFTVATCSRHGDDDVALFFPHGAKKTRARSVAIEVVKKYVSGAICAASSNVFLFANQLPELYKDILHIDVAFRDRFFMELQTRPRQIFRRPLLNDVNYPVAEVLFDSVKRSLAAFSVNFPMHREEEIYQYNEKLVYRHFYSRFKNVNTDEIVRCAPILKSINVLCTASICVEKLTGDMVQAHYTPPRLVLHNVSTVSVIHIAWLLQRPHCLTETLAINCLSECGNFSALTDALAKNKSVVNFYLERQRYGPPPICATITLRHDLAKTLVANDTLQHVDISGFGETSAIVAATKFNCFIRSADFARLCAMFHRLCVSPYVLLDIVSYLYPEMPTDVREELDKKMHRFVIARIVAVYMIDQGFRNIRQIANISRGKTDWSI